MTALGVVLQAADKLADPRTDLPAGSSLSQAGYPGTHSEGAVVKL